MWTMDRDGFRKSGLADMVARFLALDGAENVGAQLVAGGAGP